MEHTHILVVEDEFVTGAEIQARLTDMGFRVPRVVATGEEAVSVAGTDRPALVVMDITLKGQINGIEAAGQIRERYGIPVIFLTAHTDDATISRAISSEPFGYLVKPLDERALKTTIQMALYKSALDAALRERDRTIQALINANTEPMAIIGQDTGVLIINEAGKTALRAFNVPEQGVTLDVLVSAGVYSAALADAVRTHFYDKAPFSMEEDFKGRYIVHTITPLPDEQGRVIRCAVHTADVSAIKEAEQEVRRLNAQLLEEKKNLLRFKAMLDNMDDFLITTNDVGEIEFVNAAFRTRFGYVPEEVLGRPISLVRAPGDQFSIERSAFLADRKGVWTGQMTVVTKFGMKFLVSLKSTPVTGDDQKISRVFLLREVF